MLSIQDEFIIIVMQVLIKLGRSLELVDRQDFNGIDTWTIVNCSFNFRKNLFCLKYWMNSLSFLCAYWGFEFRIIVSANCGFTIGLFPAWTLDELHVRLHFILLKWIISYILFCVKNIRIFYTNTFELCTIACVSTLHFAKMNNKDFLVLNI